MADIAKTRYPQRRRGKYIKEACLECKRRKIKCNGDRPCRGCTSNGIRECRYANQEPRPHTMPSAISDLMLLSSQSDWTEWGVDGMLDLQSDGVEMSAQLTQPEGDCGSRPSFTNFIDQDGTVSDQQSGLPSNEERGTTTISTGGVGARQNGPGGSSNPTRSENGAFDGVYVTSLLFPDQELNNLVSRWFDESEFFYPFMDRADFYSRLSGLFLTDCICRNGTTSIPKTVPHLELAALTCGMAAVAKILGGGAQPDSQQDEEEYYLQSSLVWYTECLRLRDCVTSFDRHTSLDVLRLYLVEVLYSSMQDKAREMSRAMALAVEQAYALGLNDDFGWKTDDFTENEYRRLMWWTLYHLDRRVALKTGQPVLIYDQSFSVDDFTLQSKDLYLKRSCIESPQSNMSTLALNWKSPAPLTHEWYDYVQFARDWDRVVSNAWNGVFSPQAKRLPSEPELDKADRALAELLDSCPDSLRWDCESVPTFLPSGATERSYRLRFITFESIISLRLRLRVSRRPPLQAVPSLQTTEDIACQIIDAVILYLTKRERASPGTIYSSLVVLQAVNWLAPLISSAASPPSESTKKLLASVKEAKRCIEHQQFCATHGIAFQIGNILERCTNVHGSADLSTTRTNGRWTEPG